MAAGRIHTDLALETKEKFEEDHIEIRGVEIQEDYDQEKDIRKTVVKIKTENGARAMGRPQGIYITLEAPNMSVPDEDYHREISEELSRHLRELLPAKEDMKVLVVGLGNREITPDALGPDVVANLHITRHIIKEYGIQGMGEEHADSVSGIAPGVMAQTGMETMEIIRGVIEETEPDVIIAVDALAARSVRRLNRTIQITDTGIHPGSGVGNHRSGLTEETLGIKVIGIGVPTVVDGATIVHDAMAHLLDTLEETEKKEFLEEMIAPSLHSMFVTPKDVDETVKRLAYTISEGLNMTFTSGKAYNVTVKGKYGAAQTEKTLSLGITPVDNDIISFTVSDGPTTIAAGDELEAKAFTVTATWLDDAADDVITSADLNAKLRIDGGATYTVPDNYPTNTALQVKLTLDGYPNATTTSTISTKSV